MKKSLLLIITLISGFTFSQVFEQTNEPAIGNTTDFFLCDSNVTNYDGTTGAAVTWDYADIMGIPAIQKLASVIDPATSTYATDFPTSEKAIAIESSVTTFYTSETTMRKSQGFVFNEPTFGDVKVIFNVDEEQTHAYPMGLGDELTDDFDGQLKFTFQTMPQTTACNGTVYTWVDGTGTLELPGGTYNNVVRYKMIDSAYATVVLLGDIEVIRTQYEYYDFSVSNLPIFIHANIKLQSVGATTPLTNQTLVLCKDEPMTWLGLNEGANSTFAVYPNPTNGELKIKGIEGLATVEIIDQMGRTLKTFEGIMNAQSIDLGDLNAGTYFASITNGSTTSVQRVILK
jgi:hypothetical protein